MYVEVVTDQQDRARQALVAWAATFATCGYMLPWAVAATRGRSNARAIGLLNFVTGWTVVGWIIAMVMACGAHQVAGLRPYDGISRFDRP